ncbi:P-loop containing nucleoside triphosphate hydrolase protein [Auricularia subglabra TFB-10046 SS5]|nr:P-loop containing nucleoside triphosphate hydrolase protein [Auricularia subglabra TFB-10046 SS5]
MHDSVDAASAFDVDAGGKVVHSRFAGVWDLYELHGTDKWSLPNAATLHRLKAGFINLRDMHSVLVQILLEQPRICFTYFFCEIMAEVILPNVSLWLASRLLGLLNTALETQTINLRVVAMVIASKMLIRVLKLAMRKHANISTQLLRRRIQNHFIRHLVRVRARLDVPTFTDGPISRQLESATGSEHGEAAQGWGALSQFWDMVTTVMSLTLSLVVVFSMLWQNERVLPLACVAFVQPIFEALITVLGADQALRTQVWAATCTDETYIKFRGLRKTVVDKTHRQEIVVGNLDAHISSESDRLASELEQNTYMSDFSWSLRYTEGWIARATSWPEMGRILFEELPHMMLAFLALRSPQDLPLLLASMNVVESAVWRLSRSLDNLMRNGKDVFKLFGEVKLLYDLADIRNQVQDGSTPYPENARQTGLNGLCIEFRNVSFKYPGTEALVLRRVSFSIDSGALAVIVGFNGSGKSTILKLIARVYDPTEGEILIDGKDIRTLRLRDLRETLAIRDNIGYGDPANSWDEDAVDAAARLAGIDFQTKFTNGLDTYITHPVRDHYSELPEGTQSLFGREISFKTLKAGVSTRDIALSGGQTQKIAVARAIMRATSKDDRIGLLMFDEPSSAMDPIAEYSLFKTLRDIRGGKTMIFSSHRYGNLTRHADVVFYMKDGEILERGTHDELLKLDGGYAEMWKKQAEAFTT